MGKYFFFTWQAMHSAEVSGSGVPARACWRSSKEAGNENFMILLVTTAII
jgi:hypothetical protein